RLGTGRGRIERDQDAAEHRAFLPRFTSAYGAAHGLVAAARRGVQPWRGTTKPSSSITQPSGRPSLVLRVRRAVRRASVGCAAPLPLSAAAVDAGALPAPWSSSVGSTGRRERRPRLDTAAP